MADQPNQPEPGKPGEEKPRIIVDSDWKRQAQQEKERLASKEQESKPKAEGGDRGEHDDMPPADFRGLIGSIASQALLYLGGIPDPETGKAIFAPEYARHHIELLQVLEEKTKGNLTEDETRDLTEVLHELRTRYVQLARSVMASQGRTAPGPGSPGAPGGFGAPGVP